MRNTWTDRQMDEKLDTHKQTQSDAQADKAECAFTDNYALRSHQLHLSPLYLTFHHFTSHPSVLSVPHLPSPCITSHTFFFSSPHHFLSHLILPYHSLPYITSLLTPQSCQEIFLWLPSVSSTATRQIATRHFETPFRRFCGQSGTGHDSRCACSPPGK